MPPRAPARPFGAVWWLAFLLVAASATVLWSGIGQTVLAEVTARLGPRAPWAWAGVVAVAFFVLPMLLPRAAGRSWLRSTQVGALLVALLALVGAVALRPTSLPATAGDGLLAIGRLGTPIAAEPVAPAAITPVAPSVQASPVAPATLPPEAVVALPGAPRPPEGELVDTLAAFIAGEAGVLRSRDLDADAWAASLTAASARRVALGLGRDLGQGLRTGSATKDPDLRRRYDVLEAQWAHLEPRLADLEPRAALLAVAPLSLEEQRLVFGNPPEVPRPLVPWELEHARTRARACRCLLDAPKPQCLVGLTVVDMAQQDGHWRIERPASRRAHPSPMGERSVSVGVVSDAPPMPTVAADVDPAAVAALFTWFRAQWAAHYGGPVDGAALQRVLSDDAVNAELGAFAVLMEEGLSPLTHDVPPPVNLPAVFVERVSPAQRLAGCTSRRVLDTLVDTFNALSGDAGLQTGPLQAWFDAESALSRLVLRPRGSDIVDLFVRTTSGPLKPADGRLERRDGVWQYWEPPRRGVCEPPDAG